MDSDYGVKLGQALRAVARLHAVTSKLLLDCDKYIRKGRRSLFGNYVTRDLTYNVKADFWMPEGVYRHYDAGQLTVDSVTVTFFLPPGAGDPDSVPQPLFQVGQTQYSPVNAGKGADVKSVCNHNTHCRRDCGDGIAGRGCFRVLHQQVHGGQAPPPRQRGPDPRHVEGAR